MSKQFITTATVGSAHKNDIYSVAVCKPYTITASGDGFLKFWVNSISETDNAVNHVKELFVNEAGLHHVDIFEDIIDTKRHILVASVGFDGEIYFAYVDPQNEMTALEKIKLGQGGGNTKDSYWAIKFCKDVKGKTHRLAATQPTGNTVVWKFEISETGDPTFTYIATVKPQAASFATCLDLSSEENLLAVGFQNGDVILIHLETCKLIYTFHNFGLKGSSQSSSSVRSLKFSPSGRKLAIASDSGSYGTVNMYDTVYGENVGSFVMPTHSSHASVGAYAHNGWIPEIDFNESGESLTSVGFDGKVRIWNTQTREREFTLSLNFTDVASEEIDDHKDSDETEICWAFGAKFIPKGYRGGTGGGNNDGLVVIGKDRGIRWYREAGGI